jgi:PAS domain S-box-containing protein
MSYLLIVDDVEENLAYLTTLLKVHGFRVKSACNGADALAQARAESPAAVVSDLLMPVMDGYTLLRHWKSDARLKTIPFIVYTATYVDPGDERLALNLGADAFICKPSEPDVFVARLRTAVARAVTATPTDVKQINSEEKVLLAQYNESLIRKLEDKTLQLQESNRALQREVIDRNEIAQAQIAILNALAAHIAIIDFQGVIVAVNDSWHRFDNSNVFGSRHLRVGENYLEACTADHDRDSADGPRAASGIREVLLGNIGSFTIEYPHHSPTLRRWYKMIVTPLQSSRPTGAVIMHVDITDRKGAEERLRESQEQYLLLLNSTAEGIYGLDIYGVCTFCNASAARLLGFQSPSELVGEFAHERHHHSRPDGTPYPVLECKIQRVLKSGNGVHADDEVFFRKDGSPFPVEYWSHPIRRGSEIVGAVVAFLDISGRRNLEAQFLHSQKMEAVGSLAGGVAHDFNNVLQIILTCSELLEQRLVDDQEESGLAREIRTAADRGSSLTRQLLAFSRKQLLRPVRINLNSTINDIQEMLRRMIGEDVKLEIHCEPGLYDIEADRGQLEQVLMNLAVNARDAMPDGGELIVSTSNVDVGTTEPREHPFLEAGRYAMLRIRDTGTGMDQATRSRIFEPFYTTKEAGKGTGLGLSTVYGIVRQSGGFITVSSEPGKGSEFDVYFPRAQGTGTPASPAARINGGVGRSESILLVEDEGPLRKLIGDTLRAHGYRVLEAKDGTAGIDLGAQSDARLDLLLTDVILPDVSGPQVAQRLAADHPSMKVLYMSGYTDDYLTQRGVAGSDTMLLEKPFTIESLLSKIRETLDGNPEKTGHTGVAPASPIAD